MDRNTYLIAAAAALMVMIYELGRIDERRIENRRREKIRLNEDMADLGDEDARINERINSLTERVKTLEVIRAKA